MSLKSSNLLKPEVPEKSWMATEHKLLVSHLQLSICNWDLSLSYYTVTSQPNTLILSFYLFFQALRLVQSKTNSASPSSQQDLFELSILFWHHRTKRSLAFFASAHRCAEQTN